MTNELPADVSKFTAQKGLPAGETQIVDLTDGAREFKDFLQGEVVSPIKIAPIETMAALHITDRVDEKNQEGEAGRIMAALPCNATVSDHAFQQVQGYSPLVTRSPYGLTWRVPRESSHSQTSPGSDGEPDPG